MHALYHGHKRCSASPHLSVLAERCMTLFFSVIVCTAAIHPSAGPDQVFVDGMHARTGDDWVTGKMCLEKCQAVSVKEFGWLVVEDSALAAEKLRALLGKKN